MNFAHLHLILNHIPIVGIPVALIFLAYSFKTKNTATQRASLLILLGLAILVLPVYFTGEPAEDAARHLPGVTMEVIHTHEDAGQISMILTILTGALSLAALWFQKDKKKNQPLILAVMGFAFIATLSLIYTANLGGQVRHTEFRSEP